MKNFPITKQSERYLHELMISLSTSASKIDELSANIIDFTKISDIIKEKHGISLSKLS